MPLRLWRRRDEKPLSLPDGVYGDTVRAQPLQGLADRLTAQRDRGAEGLAIIHAGQRPMLPGASEHISSLSQLPLLGALARRGELRLARKAIRASLLPPRVEHWESGRLQPLLAESAVAGV